MEPSTALIPVENFQQIIQYAPEALNLNKQSVDKAKSAGQQILDLINASGMTDDLDKKCNDYLVKIATTSKTCNDRRTPLTKMFDEVRTVFTSLEKELDVKATGTVMFQIQQHRNAYATKKAQEQREREAAEARKLAIEREKISLRATLETKLSEYFQSHVSNIKTSMYNVFEGMTLETIEQVRATLNQARTYPHEHYNQFKVAVTSAYLTAEEIAALHIEVMKGRFGGFTNEFNLVIPNYRQQLLDMIPSKKMELEAKAKAEADRIAAEKAAAAAKTAAAKAEAEAKAKAAEEESKRLAELEAKRKQDEAERLAKEEAEAKLKAEQEALAKQAVDNTNASFQAELNLQTEQEPAQIREGVEITLTNSIAYLQIVSFYFEREGKSKSVEDLKKKTLASMVTYAEKVAMKTGEVISSPYIIYTDTFKAVNKKVA